MNLREPKKKKRVRLQAQPSLPIITDENGDWRIYTAHLSASGTCIVDPDEMEALYSMGYFGKGSLSRSFPSFGRRRFGAPPIVRNRQWVRREMWLKELQNLNENPDSETNPDLDDEMDESTEKELIAGNASPANGQKLTLQSPTEPDEMQERNTGENSPENILEESDNTAEAEKQSSSSSLTELKQSTENETENENSAKEETLEPPCNKKAKVEHSTATAETTSDVKQTDNNVEMVTSEDSHKDSSSVICEESAKVDEVVLDSTEDEEVCEIVDKASLDDDNDENSVHDEICVLKVNKQTNKSSEDLSKYQDEDESLTEDETDPYEVLVLPDTDSDTENYLKNIDSRIEKEGFPVNETLHLTFEETFFLMYALGCLQLIHYDGSIFSINNAWNHFQMQDKYFIQKYVAYHYFRSKGWIVKPGLKYGGDFLLYKQGPPFYHASYIVIVEVMDADTLIRDDMKSMRKITWKNLIGLERLSETISKEILFAQILWPSSIPRNGNLIAAEALSEFTVRELLWRRWNPKRKHEVESVDEEGSDSA